MPSAQECAERLREQAYKTLSPQIRDLEQELQNFSSNILTGVRQLEQKLEILSHIELPATEVVLNEILDEAIRKKDSETNTLALFAQGVWKKETQEEILGFLLDSAQVYFPRVALFAVRGDRFLGWSSRGYTDAQAKSISSCSCARSECAAFQDAITNDSSIIADLAGDGPLDILKENSSGKWRIFPLCAMQHPVAVLVGEGDGDSQSCRDAGAILASLTALRLENIALKILYELTSVKIEPAHPAPDEKPIAVSALAAVFEQAPASAFQASEASFQEVESVPAESGLEFDAAPEIMPPSVELAPEAVSSEEIEAPIEAETPLSPAPAADESRAQTQEAKQLVEEEKLHTEAKRFARLLVSEIKLYNEHHVLEGRENRDLYLRLKRDIDRSREMYEKRVSAQVSRRIDYFHDEIIRILGDNDPSTLGSDYPGPRVDS